MKTQKLLTLLSTTAALVTSIHAAEPSIPIGKLHIDSTVVEPNVIPNLSWEITHPIDITDIVDIDEENDTITTTKKLIVKVSMIGTGITDRRGREYDSISEIKFGSGPWEHIFTGPGRAVDRTDILIEKNIASGINIQFRSRYAGYSEWRYNTSSEVQVLTNGQSPPLNPASNSNAKSAAWYMKEHTTEGGKLILGDLDLIYAAELTHTNTSSAGYDMQDSIVLLRFSDIETQVGTAQGELPGNVNGGKSTNDHANSLADDESTDDSKECNREYKNNGNTDNDYSDYDTSYGSGYAGGGKKKDKSKKKKKKKKDH